MSFDIIDIPAVQGAYSSRNDVDISLIVLHSVGLDLKEVFQVFKNYSVSAHYLIPKISGAEVLEMFDEICNLISVVCIKPKILYPEQIPVIRLVLDSEKAHHAGMSNFANFNLNSECSKGLNALSIGIEFHDPEYAARGSDFYKFAFFIEQQKKVGEELIKNLMMEHSIPYQNVLAHSTIAVGRKTDPGPYFFWNDFYNHGIGYLPPIFELGFFIENPSDELVMKVQSNLRGVGFNNCPVTGILDELTHQFIDAYIMQFATNLWSNQYQNISLGLLLSLNSFDVSVFYDTNNKDLYDL